MTRSWPIWIAFTVALVVVLVALIWFSVMLVHLDKTQRLAIRQQSEAQRIAALEQDVRLALWRMDSIMAPQVAQESARPYFAYRSFLPLGRPYQNMFEQNNGSNRLASTPVLLDPAPLVLLHFQFEPGRQLTSPQVSSSEFVSGIGPSNWFVPEVPYDWNQPDVYGVRAEEYLHWVRDTVDPVSLAERIRQVRDEQQPGSRESDEEEELPPIDIPTESVAVKSYDAGPSKMNLKGLPPNQKRGPLVQQQAVQMMSNTAINNGAYALNMNSSQNGYTQQSFGQYDMAQSDESQTQQLAQTASVDVNGLGRLSDLLDVNRALMRPFWIGDRLVLARELEIDGRRYLQGCILDWDAIRLHLLDSVADLLPDADLVPVRETGENGPTAAEHLDMNETASARIQVNTCDHAYTFAEDRRLASLPVRLVPGALRRGFQDAGMNLADEGHNPLILSLVVAWACIVTAALAVVGLLLGLMSLVRRRSSFVTAVTHELRTPLTTFRMYTEMLAEGMVTERNRQQEYLSTLRSESDRLTHMVENVLAHARLNQRRGPISLQTISAGDAFRPVIERLSERAQREEMHLQVEGLDTVAPVQIKLSPTSLDQILFNLIDNACKYAATGGERSFDTALDERRIHLDFDLMGDRLAIAVRDHGPGVPRNKRRRLFTIFSKSAHEAAHDKPGVGLGLHLSRRLARKMGGRLYLDHMHDNGARFVLELPVVQS